MGILGQLFKRQRNNDGRSNVETYCTTVGEKALAGVDIILGMAGVVIAVKKIFSSQKQEGMNKRR